MERLRHYYYFDERNDDFANDGIKGSPTPADYEYFPKNILYRTLKPIVYYVYMVLVALLVKPLSRLKRVHNVGVLRKVENRRKGYFVFGNHTNVFADALLHPVVAFPRSVYIVANPDAISIPGLKTFLRMLGTVPVPYAKSTYVKYMNAIKRMYDHGHPIVVYPEAHIWPKYNAVRDFPDVSFKLPVRLGAPCFAKSTVYHKDSRGHTYAEVWYDGPFYPDATLPEKKARKELRDRIYAKICERCKDSELDCRYTYEKVDDPQEVRTEIEIV